MRVEPAADPAPESLRALRHRAEARRTAVVGVRPVTDTVKRLDADGFVVDTVDRETLRVPVAVAAEVVAEVVSYAALLAAVVDGPHEVHDL